MEREGRGVVQQGGCQAAVSEDPQVRWGKERGQWRGREGGGREGRGVVQWAMGKDGGREEGRYEDEQGNRRGRNLSSTSPLLLFSSMFPHPRLISLLLSILHAPRPLSLPSGACLTATRSSSRSGGLRTPSGCCRPSSSWESTRGACTFSGGEEEKVKRELGGEGMQRIFLMLHSSSLTHGHTP